jgi:hypothetical protein
VGQRINTADLQESMRDLGFRIGLEPTRGSIALVRYQAPATLSDWLIVEFAGKAHEAVGATVAISPLLRIPHMKLMKRQCLVDIATDSQRGWAIIPSHSARLEWLAQLHHHAPLQIAKLHREHGPELDRLTWPARLAAGKYHELFVGSGFASRADELLSALSPSVLDASKRMAERPGVLQVFGGQAVYELSCAIILHYQHQVEEGGLNYTGVNPSLDEQLMWRIQLLADRLLLAKNG